MTNNAQSFEELPIPRREYPGGAVSNYKVFKDPENFVTVTAATALEALQVSGVSHAYKILRDSMDYNKVLDAKDWLAENPPPSVRVETPVVEQAAPVEETPLSSEDVNSLLNKN